MKKRLTLAALLTIIVLLASASAFAQPVPQRIENQQLRIDQGISSGKLTPREADIVQDNLNRIKEEFSRLKADGRLTPDESARLERMLDYNSRMIAKQEEPKKLYKLEISQRIENQQRRIDQGIASGTLTRKEADIVQDNLNWIKTQYARMKADRRLTPAEIERLETMLDENNIMIYREKNNVFRRLY